MEGRRVAGDIDCSGDFFLRGTARLLDGAAVWTEFGGMNLLYVVGDRLSMRFLGAGTRAMDVS